MMHPVLFSLRRIDKNTFPELALIVLWIAGTSLGFWAACFYGDAYASFLQPLTGCLPDLGGVFASAIFPLLLSACAVILFRSAGCFGMCLLRSVSQGFMTGLVCAVYGSAGTLVMVLLTFSGVAVNIALLFFWLRRIRFGFLGFREDCTACLMACVCVGAMDYWVIGPFLADIVNF